MTPPAPKRRRTRRRQRRGVSGRALPAAYAAHVQPRFSMRTRGDGVRISGCDLVYPIAKTVVTDDKSIFSVIPCNPSYWKGTRIAQVCPAYMNYRPLAMTFSYIPQVAVTQQGTVFMGTLWNASSPADDIQQSLFTSNGGCMTQCYVPCDTRIKLGSNLQQNLFTTFGDINPDTSPFIFLAGVAGASVVPGYFYVSYTFDFKNPIGSALTYIRQYTTVAEALDLAPKAGNSSIISLAPTIKFGPGTVFQVEFDVRKPTTRSIFSERMEIASIFYDGTRVSLPDDLPVLLLANHQGFSPLSPSEPDDPDIPGEEEEEEIPEPGPDDPEQPPNPSYYLDNASFRSGENNTSQQVNWRALSDDTDPSDLANSVISYADYDGKRYIFWCIDPPRSFCGRAFYILDTGFEYSTMDKIIFGTTSSSANWPYEVTPGGFTEITAPYNVGNPVDQPRQTHVTTSQYLRMMITHQKTPVEIHWAEIPIDYTPKAGNKLVFEFVGLNMIKFWKLNDYHNNQSSDHLRWLAEWREDDTIKWEIDKLDWLYFEFPDIDPIAFYETVLESVYYNEYDFGQWTLIG